MHFLAQIIPEVLTIVLPCSVLDSAKQNNYNDCMWRKIGSNVRNYRHPNPCPVVVYRSNAGRALQVNTAVVGNHGVPLPVHNIVVAVAQMIPDLQKKWTRFGDNRRVYANKLK